MLNVNKGHILYLMNREKLTQRQFAKVLGVNEATISRYLSGKRGAGRVLINALLKAYPDEPHEVIFFLPFNVTRK